MKTTFAAVLFAAISGAAAASNETAVYITEIVTAFTTYCPAATVVTHGGSTYSVSEATTLTITDCPCTVTRSATTSAPVVAAPYSYSNGSMASTTMSGVAAATGTATTTGNGSQSTYAGAAAVNQAGLGLAAIMGLAAFAL